MAVKPKAWRYPSEESQNGPRKAICQSCRTEVRTGRYNALPMVWDREPLSATGELLALMLGLKTWHIVDLHVYRRHSLAISEEPFPRLGYLLREHRCGSTPPTGAASAPRRPPLTDSPGF